MYCMLYVVIYYIVIICTVCSLNNLLGQSLSKSEKQERVGTKKCNPLLVGSACFPVVQLVSARY